MPLKDDWAPGDVGVSGAMNAAASKINEHDEDLTGRLSEPALSATFVRFLDENGDPLVGKLVTITVNSTTGEIDDITSEDI
jgi:hypothetical protein